MSVAPARTRRSVGRLARPRTAVQPRAQRPQSNHADLRSDVEAFGLKLSSRAGHPGHQAARPEAELPGILRSACDGVVLARYIQILSGNFVGRVSVPVINIHHLFLPAFAGGEAYAGAKERASS